MSNLKIEEILYRRQLRDISQGGFSSLAVGPPGSGKTSLILYDASRIIEWHPHETLFWRDSPNGAAQFNRIGKCWQIFAEDGVFLRFRDLTKGGSLEIPYKTFKDFDELINQDTGKGMCKPRQLNVIFFKDDYKWIDLLQHLRSTIGWQSVFLDEIEDICPLNPGKRPGEKRNIRNEKNILFANNAKAIRRGLVNLFCDTQNISELDWRFIGKINFICYLRGARVFSESRIKQVAVDRLPIGRSYLDWENRMYGKSFFPAFPPKKLVFEVIKD
jgi:hypothetical protein